MGKISFLIIRFFNLEREEREKERERESGGRQRKISRYGNRVIWLRRSLRIDLHFLSEPIP